MKNIKLKEYSSMWKDYEIKLNFKFFFTKIKIKESLFQYWNEILLNKVLPEQYLLIQFKVKISSGIFRSISHVQTVKFIDYTTLLETFIVF